MNWEKVFKWIGVGVVAALVAATVVGSVLGFLAWDQLPLIQLRLGWLHDAILNTK